MFKKIFTLNLAKKEAERLSVVVYLTSMCKALDSISITHTEMEF